MKIEIKTVALLDDKKFVEYANKRGEQEMRRMELHEKDAFYEDLYAKVQDDVRYVTPMVEYLTCRLHKAKLEADKEVREREIWWVWAQAKSHGVNAYTFIEHYAPLLCELDNTIMPMMFKEYKNKQKCNKNKKKH